MFKRLDPRDINVTPFKAYKEFTVTNTDSGSGVYGFRAISSSAINFDPDTATKTTFDSASFYQMPRFSYVNGRYLPHTRAMVSVEDRGYQLADGVYEVIAIYNGKLIQV